MRLSRLTLRNFRPFSLLEVCPAAGINFFVGANGTGKTSLLEAAAMLIRLQSPRTSTPAECIRFGAAGFGLSGSWGEKLLRFEYAEKCRRLSVDGVPCRSVASYLSNGRAVWISNPDLGLVGGASSGRRRYLDVLGTQVIPGYLKELRAYERALRGRNILLRERRPAGQIEAFNEPLVRSGEVLGEARSSLISRLLAPVAGHYHGISGGTEELTLVPRPGYAGSLADELRQRLPQDIQAGTTTGGPHRDDLLIQLEGREASRFASEGQQRSIVLALKLAQVDVITQASGVAPLILVDDVFGELDPERRNRLLAYLSSDAQVLVSTTHLGWLDQPPSAVWEMGSLVTANGSGKNH